MTVGIKWGTRDVAFGLNAYIYIQVAVLWIFKTQLPWNINIADEMNAAVPPARPVDCSLIFAIKCPSNLDAAR